MGLTFPETRFSFAFTEIHLKLASHSQDRAGSGSREEILLGWCQFPWPRRHSPVNGRAEENDIFNSFALLVLCLKESLMHLTFVAILLFHFEGTSMD